jgi:hypothetical protein
MKANDMRVFLLHFVHGSGVLVFMKKIDGEWKRFPVNAFSGNPPLGTRYPVEIQNYIKELLPQAYLLYKHAVELRELRYALNDHE